MVSDADYVTLLTEQVSGAIRKSVATFQAAHPDADLRGYAIVTEDELLCLGYLASTSEFLKQDGHPATRYQPVDWPFDDGVEAFDVPRALMAAHSARASELATHVRESFGVLVDCLMEARRSGLFGAEVFLSVLSTDPNDLLESLEDDAVRVLNDDTVYARWRAAMWGTQSA